MGSSWKFVKLDPKWIGDSWDKSSPSNSSERGFTTKILAPLLEEFANCMLRGLKLRLGPSDEMEHEKKLHFLREFLLFRLEKGIMDWSAIGLNRLHGQKSSRDSEQSRLAEGACEIIYQVGKPEFGAGP